MPLVCEDITGVWWEKISRWVGPKIENLGFQGGGGMGGLFSLVHSRGVRECGQLLCTQISCSFFLVELFSFGTSTTVLK